MNVNPQRVAWLAAAESAIRELRDVEGVRIQGEGDEVREIHVVSSSHRPPKQIVRDIQSMLFTRFNRSIDHRVVSVAFTGRSPAHMAPRPVAPAGPRVIEPRDIEPMPAPLGLREAHGSAEPIEAAEDRIRFGSVNLYVSGPRAQVQVELRWKGLTHSGSATGWSSRDGSQRLVAAATLAAVQEFMTDDVGLALGDLEIVRMGRQEVVVVGLTLLAHRQEKLLVGSCAVEQDAQQAVALATLAALNRVVGGLRTKEPTEYVLRPSSTQEASGAKRT
jgi:hypothetical protein